MSGAAARTGRVKEKKIKYIYNRKDNWCSKNTGENHRGETIDIT